MPDAACGLLRSSFCARPALVSAPHRSHGATGRLKHDSGAIARPDPRSRKPGSPASLWLLLAAFANGCTAMTGVEAVSEPTVDFGRAIEEKRPGRLVAVIIPELVAPHWHEYVLHNVYGEALKTLLYLKGSDRVVVINSPWHLRDPADADQVVTRRSARARRRQARRHRQSGR